MKLSYSQTRKIVKTTLILIIVLIIIIVLYFFVLNKSSSKDQTNTNIENTYPIITRSNNELVFCFANTSKDSSATHPYRHFGEESFNTQVFSNADNGIASNRFVLNKWVYDTTNPLSIERTINNTNNIYTQDELSALGKTDKPNTYLVNKLIPLYDKDDLELKSLLDQGLSSDMFTPWFLSLYSNCK